MRDDREGLSAKRRQYLLATLIIGMAVTGSLLLWQVPPFFSSGGGDPVTAGLLVFLFAVFTVGARIVRPHVLK